MSINGAFDISRRIISSRYICGQLTYRVNIIQVFSKFQYF